MKNELLDLFSTNCAESGNLEAQSRHQFLSGIHEIFQMWKDKRTVIRGKAAIGANRGIYRPL